VLVRRQGNITLSEYAGLMPSSGTEVRPDFGWRIFVTEESPGPGLYELQWQATGLDIDLVACDLSFAQRTIDFIAKTRDNPDFRDIPLGNGIYKQVVTELELDDCFVDTKVRILKDGECDSRYFMRIGGGNLWFYPRIYGAQVDHLLDTLNEIIEHHCYDEKDGPPECS
jgi:hypothetical protein